MRVPFEKWHGLGNDFVLVRRADLPDPTNLSVFERWCDRHLGVGADGVLILWDERSEGFSMRVVNADGSVPEVCGNGIRCAVRSWAARNDVDSAAVTVATDAGDKRCVLSSEGVVSVEMGPASLVDDNLPAPDEPGQPAQLEVELGDETETGFAVSLGNPHLVLLRDAGSTVAAEAARRLEHLASFPQRTNVELVHRLSSNHLRVVVWERGVGFTRACGSGACAAAAAAMLKGWVNAEQTVNVELDGGTLQISVSADLSLVVMTGPATFVFSGTVAWE